MPVSLSQRLEISVSRARSDMIDFAPEADLKGRPPSPRPFARSLGARAPEDSPI